MANISLRLKQIRRDRSLSQEDLAQKLGISRQAIIALEQGASLPSLPVIMALLRVLDITFDDLCGTEWSPFRDINPSEDAASSSLTLYRHSEGSQHIPLLLQETPNHFALAAELPGVQDEDVTVDVGQQHILIMAIKRPHLAPNEQSRQETSEINFGPLMRIVTLPTPIDASTAQADFVRGVLHLTLPKLKPETKRRITFTKEDYGSK